MALPLGAATPGATHFGATNAAPGASHAVSGMGPASSAIPGNAPGHARAFATHGVGPGAARGSSLATLSQLPSWWNVTAVGGTSLTPFWYSSSTWDAADRYALLYGGDNNVASGFTIFNQTWAFAGTNWSRITANGTPGPLDGPSLAYDPAIGKVVMFGGISAYLAHSVTANNKTYQYSGGQWSTFTTTTAPLPRVAASMAYDPDLGGVVLFGGETTAPGYPVANDLWLYKGGIWSALPDVAGPAARQFASLAYDPEVHALVLFGGTTLSYQVFNDTWEYRANETWTQPSHGSMAAVYGAMMDYDPDLGGLVLVGGSSMAGVASTSAEIFRTGEWSLISTVGSPTSHTLGVGVYDPVSREFIAAGGLASPIAGTVSGVTDVMVVANSSLPAQTEAGQTVWANATGVGANGTYRASWQWGDGSSDSAAADASHQYATAGTFLVNLTVNGPNMSTVILRDSIDVFARPTASISTACPGADAGVPTRLFASPVGGVGPFTFTWNLGGTVASGSPVNFTFPTVGAISVAVNIFDGVGGRGSSSTTVMVNASPSVSISPLPPVDAGVPFYLSANSSGGTPPTTLNWSSPLGALTAQASGGYLVSTGGAFPLNLTLRDACGGIGYATKTLTVAFTPTAKVTGPSEVTTGSAASWTATITQGSAPFTIDWSASDGASGHGSGIDHAFSSTGRYWVNATVTDAAGSVVAASLSITVNPPSGSSNAQGSSALQNWELIAGVGLAAIGIAAGVAAATLRSRRK